MNPKDADAYAHRGVAWRNKGNLQKALADSTAAIRLDPKHASAFDNRGLIWEERAEWDKAITDWSEAIRIDPSYAKAYSNLARLRLQARTAAIGTERRHSWIARERAN
jgi:tetratricopeptide (TPR) repeat protein